MVRSSVTPSAKYSCSGSPVMLAKGSTATTGGPEDGNGGAVSGRSEPGGDAATGGATGPAAAGLASDATPAKR